MNLPIQAVFPRLHPDPHPTIHFESKRLAKFVAHRSPPKKLGSHACLGCSGPWSPRAAIQKPRLWENFCVLGSCQTTLIQLTAPRSFMGRQRTCKDSGQFMGEASLSVLVGAKVTLLRRKNVSNMSSDNRKLVRACTSGSIYLSIRSRHTIATAKTMSSGLHQVPACSLQDRRHLRQKRLEFRGSA